MQRIKKHFKNIKAPNGKKAPIAQPEEHSENEEEESEQVLQK